MCDGITEKHNDGTSLRILRPTRIPAARVGFRCLTWTDLRFANLLRG
jgi:hypothetical protein